MKKIASLILLFGLLTIVLCGCKRGENLPFQAEKVGSIEVYRYEGVPAAAEKKTVTDPGGIEAVCRQLLSVGAPKDGKSLAGGTVISFRVNLDNGTGYEVIYSENMSEGFEKSETIWNALPCEAAAAETDELPALE